MTSWALVAALLVSSGCASLTEVVPSARWWWGDAVTGPDRLSAVALWVEPFTTDAETEMEPWVLAGLRGSFASYVRFAGTWASVLEDEAERAAFVRAYPDVPVVRLVPRLVQRYSVSRTYVLDLLSLMTLGYFPLSPSWGEVDVDVAVDVIGPDGRPLCEPVRARVATSHGTLTWSLVRVDMIEDALKRVYGRAFEDLSAEVTRRVAARARAGQEAAVAALGAATSTTVATSSAAVAALTSTRAVPMAPQPEPEPRVIAWRLEGAQSALGAVYGHQPVIEPGPIWLPPDGFDILTRPLARDDDGLLSRYLGALGGIEAGAFRGGAIVESRTQTVNAADELVGSGRADASGYRFSFYRPPDRTGFFFPPSIGLLWEDITLTGFRDTIPLAQSGDIPAVFSDPATGIAVDVAEPLAYDLALRSAFVGQGLGFNLVAGDEDVQLFFTLQGHVNLLEVRYVDVTIGRSNVEGFSVTAFQSLGLGGQLGLVFPSAHLALRGTFAYEWFFDFDFPQPVEFQAAVSYNPEKDVFERQRAFVNGASVRTYHAQIAVAVLF